MYTTIGTYYSLQLLLLYLLYFLDDSLPCCPDWIGCNRARTADSHLKRIISTNCCIHTVVPTDDGPRYARNM